MKIDWLEIKTLNINRQQEFYKHILGLETSVLRENSFRVNIGSSILQFNEDKNATPYHIAFHIPPNQEKIALEWIKEKIGIQKNGMEEIVDFSAWNAKSLYFYDADRNILEFISRKDLFPAGDINFTGKNILGIAEIGLATNDIAEKFQILNEKGGLEKYDGNFENFCAIGDDEGLIITIDKNKKDWFPTNDKAFASDFEMTFRREDKIYKLVFREDRLRLSSPDIKK